MIPGASQHDIKQFPRMQFLPIRAGMDYEMEYGGRNVPAPSVAPPIPRQSLAQTVLVHRYQRSHYISRLTRVMSALPLIGYPQAKVLTLRGGAPAPNQVPIMSSYPATAAGGTMSPSPRFRKALPTKINKYVPPTY